MSTNCIIGHYGYRSNFVYPALSSSSTDLNNTIKSYDIMLRQSLDKKRNGDFWEFMLILEREPIVSKCFSKNEFTKLSLLWISVLAGYHRSAELLVRSGVDVNERFGCHDPQVIDENWTILHLLLEMKTLPEIHDLIRLVRDYGADLQAKDKDGQTPLHFAVKNKLVQLTEMLLEKGADVNVANKRGMTPLLIAASKDFAACLVPLLMKHGADIFVKNVDGQNVLHYLSMNLNNSGLVKLAKSLLEKGVSPHGRDQNQLQPIHYAVKNGNYELVEIFLDHGADVNVQISDDGQSLLYYATCNFPRIGSKEVVKTLLKRGADVHQRTHRDHSTALHGICDSSANLKTQHITEIVEGIIELLLSAGADVLAEASDGRTPLARIWEGSNEGMEQVWVPLGTWGIIKALALIKVRRAIIELKDERIIEQFPVLRSYYQRCIEEIEKMRSMRFIVTCSLFDLLTKSEYQIATLMTNPEFKPKFSLCSLGGFDEFPIYAGSFLKAFKRAERYFESMIEQENIVNEAVYYSLPFLVVRNVVRHILNDRDYSSKRM